MTQHKAIMMKLISAKVELEYYGGLNKKEYIRRAIANIDKAMEILMEQEDWRGEYE